MRSPIRKCIFESIDMKSIFSISIFIFLCGVVKAQLLFTPSFHENTLVNNPAALGAIQQEGIQINTFSTRVFTTFFFSGFPPSTILNNLVPNISRQANIFDLKNFSSISYHNTQTLPNKFKVTVGVQLQTTQNRLTKFTANNTYGFTANVHIPLKKANRERYFSAGLQMNLIHQKPDKAVTAFAFENLIEMPTIDYTTFNRQLSSTGFQYTLNTSYLTHKYKKFLFNIGLSFSAVESKIVTVFRGIETGSFSFRSNVKLRANIFLNAQFVPVKEKLMLDAKILASNDDLFGSFGLGFKLKKNTILRIIGTGSTHFEFETIGATLGLDILNFSYFLYYGNLTEARLDFIINGEAFERPGKILQAGVNYRLNGDNKPTLLNLKY